MTIRSFRMQNMFSKENVKRVNANLHMDFHNNGSNEWLGFRLEMLGSLPFCISTMFMILLPSSIIKPENVGLTVSYGLSLNGVLFWGPYILAASLKIGWCRLRGYNSSQTFLQKQHGRL